MPFQCVLMKVHQNLVCLIFIFDMQFQMPTKATRVLEDPALFGTTYAGATYVKGKDRFECTWRGYTELDKYNEFLVL